MRKSALIAALIAPLALIAALSPASAREAQLVYGQTWRMPQDLARMDAAQPQSALTIAQQRARRAAYQASKARGFSGTAQRVSR